MIFWSGEFQSGCAIDDGSGDGSEDYGGNTCNISSKIASITEMFD